MFFYQHHQQQELAMPGTHSRSPRDSVATTTTTHDNFTTRSSRNAIASAAILSATGAAVGMFVTYHGYKIATLNKDLRPQDRVPAMVGGILIGQGIFTVVSSLISGAVYHGTLYLLSQ